MSAPVGGVQSKCACQACGRERFIGIAWSRLNSDMCSVLQIWNSACSLCSFLVTEGPHAYVLKWKVWRQGGVAQVFLIDLSLARQVLKQWLLQQVGEFLGLSCR